MPVITPPTRTETATRYLRRGDPAVRRLYQHYTVEQGLTLFRVDGTWHLQSEPSQAVLDTADLVFLGGHLYDISPELYDEITAAGIDLPVTGEAVYPSGSTYPSMSLNPGG